MNKKADMVKRLDLCIKTCSVNAALVRNNNSDLDVDVLLKMFGYHYGKGCLLWLGY